MLVQINLAPNSIIDWFYMGSIRCQVLYVLWNQSMMLFRAKLNPPHFRKRESGSSAFRLDLQTEPQTIDITLGLRSGFRLGFSPGFARTWRTRVKIWTWETMLQMWTSQTGSRSNCKNCDRLPFTVDLHRERPTSGL